MNSHIVVRANQSNFISRNNFKNFKEGSQVLVRVISDKGNGRYEGSVGGIKTFFTAKNPLNIGTAFIAELSVQNGKILIHPKEDLNSIPVQINELTVVDNDSMNQNIFAPIENQMIADFVSQFNVPVDNFSFHLLQQMKQLGMKFDGELLLKIRNSAVKFLGKEKRTGELLILLAQKGFFPDDEELEELINQLEENGNFGEEEKLKSKVEFREKNPADDFKKIVTDFISSIFKGVNQNNIGLLTVLNQASFAKNQTSETKWIILPFEMVENNEKNYSILGNGNIKIFLDECNHVSKINLLCNYKNNISVFLLEFDKNQISKVKFNVNRQLENDDLIRKFSERIKSLNKNVSIEWCDFSKLEGTCCENEKLFLFNGEI